MGGAAPSNITNEHRAILGDFRHLAAIAQKARNAALRGNGTRARQETRTLGFGPEAADARANVQKIVENGYELKLLATP
jgi:hypothetical protein